MITSASPFSYSCKRGCLFLVHCLSLLQLGVRCRLSSETQHQQAVTMANGSSIWQRCASSTHQESSIPGASFARCRLQLGTLIGPHTVQKSCWMVIATICSTATLQAITRALVSRCCTHAQKVCPRWKWSTANTAARGESQHSRCASSTALGWKFLQPSALARPLINTSPTLRLPVTQ